MDDSEDDFRSYFQITVILQLVQHIFREMLIGGRKIAYTDSFFEATNIRKTFKMIHQSLKDYFTKLCPRNHF